MVPKYFGKRSVFITFTKARCRRHAQVYPSITPQFRDALPAWRADVASGSNRNKLQRCSKKKKKNGSSSNATRADSESGQRRGCQKAVANRSPAARAREKRLSCFDRSRLSAYAAADRPTFPWPVAGTSPDPSSYAARRQLPAGFRELPLSACQGPASRKRISVALRDVADVARKTRPPQPRGSSVHGPPRPRRCNERPEGRLIWRR